MKRSPARRRAQALSRQIDVETRRTVLLRDGSACLRCGLHSTQIHHRRPRGMGGTRDPRINDPRNLVVLCGSGVEGCHGWVESHRRQARADGWLIGSLSEEELYRPIHLGFGTWCQLEPDGTKRYSRPVDSGTPPRKETP